MLVPGQALWSESFPGAFCVAIAEAINVIVCRALFDGGLFCGKCVSGDMLRLQGYNGIYSVGKGAANEPSLLVTFHFENTMNIELCCNSLFFLLDSSVLM